MTSHFEAGSRIGGYVLDAYLGGGGFGSVWRAHDEASGEPVAVKLLGTAGANASAIRAEVELLAANAAARSSHVVRVLGGGGEPVPYIVMEYIEGTDLAALLREGKLSIDKTIEIGIAIADALRALNEAGIVHRDVKPANVMMDKSGAIKLADFGIAKIVGYETVTMTGQVALTMAYAAPEVWEDDESEHGRPSYKSDLYAMGTLIFECLAGAPPFRGNYGALYRAHREQSPDLALVPPETPASLRYLVTSCLAKEQDERPDSAAECLTYLQRARVELAEARGSVPEAEPKHFGAWLREAPHRSLPWTWLCRNETTGQSAVVEVHFVASLDDGARLRAALDAAPKFASLGAAKLLETNRLVLRPGEDWIAPPEGQFQFWLAREEVGPASRSGVVSAPMLRQAAGSLVAFIDAARDSGISISLRSEELSMESDGRIRLLRPGLGLAAANPEEDGLSFLRSLPLDDAARALITATPELRALAPVRRNFGQASSSEGPVVEERETAPDESLQVCSNCKAPVAPGEPFCGNCGQRIGRSSGPACPRCNAAVVGDEVFCGNCGQRVRGDAPALVAVARPEATAPQPVAQATSVAPSSLFTATLNLRRLDGPGSRQELVVHNFGAAPLDLVLDATDPAGALAVSLEPRITVPAGANQRVQLSVAPRGDTSLSGAGKLPFTVRATNATGGTPLTIDGDYEDTSSNWTVYAVSGLLLLAALVVLGAALLR